MQKRINLLLVLGLLSALFFNAFGQAPVGTITGTVYDETGAVIPNAEVSIRNKATGIERKLTSGADGGFSAPALVAGEWEVTVGVKGFRTLKRDVTVATGSVIQVEMRMQVGQAAEVVSVEAAAAQMSYEQHAIEGVITRTKIQDLPLNGRSFLQLAFLEPGVTVNPGTTSQYNSLFSVSVLGADSNKTAITVDGGNVRNSIEGNTGMNFSQEVVQEFQLSSNNFDLSTGITSSGAVNIVTRTGGNDYHGSGYFFFRDRNMAAYPGLRRPPGLNCQESEDSRCSPFFARRNPGTWFSGPLIKDRLFFFGNYEYSNQTQAFTVAPDLPSIAGLAGNFGSPYSGHLFSVRFDWRATDKHNVFLRYSGDRNRGFGPSGGSPLPSNWLQNRNWADQYVLGVTSSLTSTLVNDFRGSYNYWQNRNLFADQSVCPDCIGLGFPQITLVGSSNFAIGNTSNATQGRDLRRFNFVDTLTWQKGSHRMRFGGEFEYAPGTGFWGYCDPACGVAFSPEAVRAAAGALTPVLFPNLPTTIRTNADLLNLPFAGAVVGVGDPGQPPPFNIEKAKLNQRVRFFAQDTWKVTSRFTLNYGIAWNFESTLVNRDLDKPRYLAPLYGNDLSPTNNNYNNWSPSVGFAWNVGKDNKTVIRGGAGIYYETELLWRRLQERAFIGPRGNGRVQFPHTGFRNIYPGILNLGAGGAPVPVGAFLPANTLTTMTLAQFNEIVRQQLPAVQAQLAPANPPSLDIRSIQLNKSAQQLYPSDYPVQRSYQMSIGVQRELVKDLVVSADYVRRVFVNTLIGEVDRNRFNRFVNGVQSPVIPRCTSAAQVADPTANCSQGAISFWTPEGRGVYNGLLVKLDKRFSKRYLFTVSYALTDQSGINGIVNLDNLFQSYGPQAPRHILNVSAIVDLPWGVQLGFISAFNSRSPVMANVPQVDIDGDGITTTPIPGVDYNCFNRGCGKAELEAAVAAWNQRFPAGSRDARGQAIPQLILPANYEFGDNFSSQDIRLTKTFTWRERYKLAVFGEMFNVFNVANLSQFNFNLDARNANPAAQTFSFGQANQRVVQTFGSGGPRALQLGARITF